jgi:hypothetical protein
MKTGRKSNSFIRYLPAYGCISTGLIYFSIGLIAILSFLKIKQGGADESSLVAFLNDYFIGRIFIWIILLGTVSYITWRILESIQDPYKYGKTAKGLILRIGIALSTIPDILIAYTASQSLFGKKNLNENGIPKEERQLVNSILESWGSWIIILLGLIILLTAIVQLIYGVSRGYRERLDIKHYNSTKRTLVHALAWAGYSARGIIVGIIGFFATKAGIEKNASLVVNTDKAFDFIGDHVGHPYFIIVAAGTMAYGVFMIILGIEYDADKD